MLNEVTTLTGGPASWARADATTAKLQAQDDLAQARQEASDNHAEAQDRVDQARTDANQARADQVAKRSAVGAAFAAQEMNRVRRWDETAQAAAWDFVGKPLVHYAMQGLEIAGHVAQIVVGAAWIAGTEGPGAAISSPAASTASSA